MTYQEFFTLAKHKGIDNIQITEETGYENSIYYINKSLEDYTDYEKVEYTIKAEVNGKTEQLYTEYIDETIIDILLEKINSTDSNYQNDYLNVTENNKLDEDFIIDVSKEKAIIPKLNKLKELFPSTKNLELFYTDFYIKTRIINNKGVDISTAVHNYKLYAEASAEHNKKIATYSETLLVNDKNKIDFTKIVQNVLSLATLAINKEKIANKKYNIVLGREVAYKFLNELQKMLSADNIHQKKSCLENKLNKKIFSDKLTIMEEPLNKNYPGYTIFDKEGTKTYNKNIVTNGKLDTYLYDIKEAKIDNTLSTGNKYETIGTKNMYVKPGTKSLDELFIEMNDGIYLTHSMGSMGSSINCNTGAVSLQVFGYLIKNGKIVGGIEPAVMTTTIFELLSNVEEVGNELYFESPNGASPALYTKNISLAG